MWRVFFFLTFSILILSSPCFGLGEKYSVRELTALSDPEEVFDLALKGAEKMCEECKNINPFNFPVLVSIGTSKSRGVITLRYRFDPEAGSVCTKPPIDATSFIKRTFVPHFGAEFYMHIRLAKEAEKVSLNIEVTQMKGIKKEIFGKEMERLVEVYKSYVRDASEGKLF